MCVYNAKRDSEILKPLTIHTTDGKRHWDPLSGAMTLPHKPVESNNGVALPFKRLKGQDRYQSLTSLRLANPYPPFFPFSPII